MAEKASTNHCTYCFDTLLASLKDDDVPSPSFEDANCALFVTWKTHFRGAVGNWDLRGCIGTLTPRSLKKYLGQYAIISAFKDSRFKPIPLKEVPYLKCTVSLLSDFKDASDYLDWDVGTHGLIICFEDQDGNDYSATYLPEIALEQQWEKKQCIDSLIHKAGYRGKVTEALRKRIQVQTYVSTTSEVTYDEYSTVKKKKVYWSA
mmetsp:Transcript_23152/g.40999  ORF Transcript_23152/g.40999 Transcript_23152/m.40999 type:complete len:205 (-) Transcript_23152:114-728(-)|eukprot:CAMPEP_0175045538 /NCGR_PEP_ID=MMETSP0052_2-20121109/4484_1 /TAXON_ID=51329 ORGANISM="Polytomella parva, Strain SAG 63-3" /NCGR_SAMPLE_ID=MMETSP0052_2 /ASSEMBLY_ACC=CAM_ASM_000194 /LENGTH=204 /DNA_ID=CAMNT_0016309091 /DNA_START=302 /DNA_END=916 /DNA_ORIENTATION=-